MMGSMQPISPRVLSYIVIMLLRHRQPQPFTRNPYTSNAPSYRSSSVGFNMPDTLEVERRSMCAG
jgi:hypothetical protein